MSAALPTRLLAASAVFSAVMTAACQSMEPSDNPLEPVAVEAVGGSAPAAPAAEADDRFASFDDVGFVMSSEQLRSGEAPAPSADADAADADADAGDAAADAAVDATDAADAGTEEAVEDVAAPAPAPVSAGWAASAPAAAPAMVGAAFGSAGWPVRLVRTLPETQPPRAILGLADGREIVVSPGSMVPDQNLVVMAIGKQTAEVARVVPAGDHAVVSPMTLTALY